MALTLTQSAYALTANVPASFLAIGGTSPYVYSVVGGGAGGVIDATTGVYKAPVTLNSDPVKSYDTVRVVDSLNHVVTTTILVGSPLLLLCDILQRELALTSSHIYLWDQKIQQPTDNSLYIAVSVLHCKVIGNSIRPDATGTSVDQSINMLATVDIDIISRGPEARDRKEEVVLALNSIYSLQQQDANSFFVGRIPPGSQFINLSSIDGAAIPYRFKITVNMQYFLTRNKPAPYFDTFTNQEFTNA